EGLFTGMEYGDSPAEIDGVDYDPEWQPAVNPYREVGEDCEPDLAHDRKIAAEALREAAEIFARTVGEPAHPGRSVVCLDMYTGVVTDVQTWLRERADRIEQGGQG